MVPSIMMNYLKTPSHENTHEVDKTVPITLLLPSEAGSILVFLMFQFKVTKFLILHVNILYNIISWGRFQEHQIFKVYSRFWILKLMQLHCSLFHLESSQNVKCYYSVSDLYAWSFKQDAFKGEMTWTITFSELESTYLRVWSGLAIQKLKNKT